MLLYLVDFVGDTLKCSRVAAIIFISFSMSIWIGILIVNFSETGMGILVQSHYGDSKECPQRTFLQVYGYSLYIACFYYLFQTIMVFSIVFSLVRFVELKRNGGTFAERVQTQESGETWLSPQGSID